MTKKFTKIGHHTNEEELFLSSAITDLRKGLITYVYKENILEELKKIFSDLDIRKKDFYWIVTRKK